MYVRECLSESFGVERFCFFLVSLNTVFYTLNSSLCDYDKLFMEKRLSFSFSVTLCVNVVWSCLLTKLLLVLYYCFVLSMCVCVVLFFSLMLLLSLLDFHNRSYIMLLLLFLIFCLLRHFVCWHCC